MKKVGIKDELNKKIIIKIQLKWKYKYINIET